MPSKKLRPVQKSAPGLLRGTYKAVKGSCDEMFITSENRISQYLGLLHDE